VTSEVVEEQREWFVSRGAANAVHDLKKLKLETFGLAAGAEATVVDTLGIQLDLLRERGHETVNRTNWAQSDGRRTVPSVKPKRFCTSEVNSRMRRPLGPRTSIVRVALMIISVLIGVLRTSTPEKPSSASSLDNNSRSSA
jgi:hypothetical protein